MSGNTDFVVLYQKLGLDSGCTLEAFRQAYRKRVGAIHPDRPGANAVGSADLQQLNALYSAAMEFHRRHGRLPGASQPTMPGVASVSGGAPMAPPQDPVGASESRRSSRWMLVALALLVAGFWLYSLPGDERPPAAPAQPARAIAEIGRAIPRTPPAADTAIVLGSSANQVRELHGAPVSGWEQRWEYGPSWVAFRCGVVVDWYSSPLRPLRVNSEHPPATTRFTPPRHCRE